MPITNSCASESPESIYVRCCIAITKGERKKGGLILHHILWNGEKLRYSGGKRLAMRKDQAVISIQFHPFRRAC